MAFAVSALVHAGAVLLAGPMQWPDLRAEGQRAAAAAARPPGTQVIAIRAVPGAVAPAPLPEPEPEPEREASAVRSAAPAAPGSTTGTGRASSLLAIPSIDPRLVPVPREEDVVSERERIMEQVRERLRERVSELPPPPPPGGGGFRIPVPIFNPPPPPVVLPPPPHPDSIRKAQADSIRDASR